jgi:hypothetical protein
MAPAKLKKQMLDYICKNLDGSVEGKGLVVPGLKTFFTGIVTAYVKVGNDGLVLVVDQEYPEDRFSELYKRAQHQTPNNVGIVFLKDGKTFFRSAAARNYFKKSQELSLKHYNPEQMQSMILLRPEERFLVNRARRLQYYQPASERLEEGIETFDFTPVRFDYSHINPEIKFKPEDRFSERLFLHKSRNHQTEPVKLVSGYLVPRQ